MANFPGRSVTSPPSSPSSDNPTPNSNASHTGINASPSPPVTVHRVSATSTPKYSPPHDLTSSASQSNGVDNGNGTTASTRAQFTTSGDDDWETDTEEPPRPHETAPGDLQVPPVAHRPSYPPSYLEAELPPEYGSAVPTLTSRDQRNVTQSVSGIQSAENIRGQRPQYRGGAIQSAVERAQSLTSQLRRPSHFRRRMRSQDGTHTGSTPQEGGPGSNGDAVISMDTGEKGSNTNVNAERQRRYSARATEANELVDKMKKSASNVPQSKFQRSHSSKSPPDEAGTVDEGANNRRHRPSILADLLRLQRRAEEKYHERTGENRRRLSPCNPSSSRSSVTSTPRSKLRWYDKRNQSSSSISSINSETTLNGESGNQGSSGMFTNAVKRLRNKGGLEDEIGITVHIAETISRQRYLEKLCEALMAYGAPTHRLEECMRMTSRVLDLDSQFLYLPGCMFVSFDDPSTHTTDLRMRRYAQGVELGRLEDVHDIYKQVVHDVIGVEEAMEQLDGVNAQKPRYKVLILILLYGFASASVGPFGFNARAIDIPIAFILGCILGVLKYLAVPRSRLYANVFELTAALLTSFLSRAFGSIRRGDERIFCFPALAQSSIALILPGFMVLSSSLELQSQNILAGSVRLVFAIIYSLVLGFGIMLGTSFYGRMDSSASSAYTCPTSPSRNVYAHNFPSVIAFTICMCAINQAKWTQMPVMVVISFMGYIVNFFSGRLFPSNMQIANAMGAFAIGIMGNLYSRVGRGLAAAAMLPAILVQVPSGLAASGSIVSGLAFANELTQNATNTTAVKGEGSEEILKAIKSSGAISSGSGAAGELATRIGSNKVYGNIVFELAYAMVQVSISTTVGLFLAALVVYPEGKRRSELFSF